MSALFARRGRGVGTLLAALLVLGFVVSTVVPFGGLGGAGVAAPTHAPLVAHETPRASAASVAARAPALPHEGIPASPQPVQGPSHAGPGLPGPGTPGPAAPLSASGRGTFFTSTSVPLPTSPTPLFYGPHINDTASPSVAVTPTGDAVLAYTAFTNASPCANSTPFAITEVGVVASSNNGSTWSSPQYLGNPDCTQAYNYTSAWQPSVAVLANGTFVMAYIEYNTSFAAYCPQCIIEDAYPNAYYYDRLVLTFSYNDGANWTNPVPLNSSINPSLSYRANQPMLPQVAAVGDTVYVLWENYTYPQFYYDGSTGLHLIVSTNGGLNWSNESNLPVQPGIYFGSYWYDANNPDLLIGPGGEVFVAYTTNYTESAPPICQPYACSPYYWDTLNVVVASSTDNGTNWSVSTLQKELPWQEDDPGFAFVSTAPQLAYDPISGNLYAVWVGEAFSTSCYTYPLYSGCWSNSAPAPWISVSSNLGVSWSAPRLVSFNLDDPYGGPWDQSENVGVGVNATGAVFVSDVFTNESVCGMAYYGLDCGAVGGVMVTSTDHGATFTGPYPLGPAIINSYYWPGTTSPFVTLAGNLTNAWSSPNCPNWNATGGCYWVNGNGFANVTLSQEFVGVGTTVAFNETNLPSGLNWTASLTGNVRAGPAGTDLTVSGVPIGPNETWQVDWVNTTYGHAWGETVSPTSPGPILGPTTINATYEPYVLLQVRTVPPPQADEPFNCPSASLYTFTEACSNEAIQPTAGRHWIPQGSLLPYNVTDSGFAYYCYYCYNLTFLSWTGNGWGSWNSTAPNGTTVLNGPVNETANFRFDSTCFVYGPSSPTCTNITYDYLFTETGLPDGTTWAVTLNGSTASSNSSVIAFSEGQGPYNFTVWSIPINANWSWVGTPSYASPITALQGAIETVHFVKMANTAISSDVTFGASGLPAGVSSWSLELDNTTYGVPAANTTFSLPTGAYTLAANPVYGANEVGAYVVDFSVEPLSVNGTNFTVAPGGAFNVSGPALVTAHFAPEFFLTVSASAGGNVTPSYVGWVPYGHAVNLTATPSAGYAFVGWSGSGPGSVTDVTATITVAPGGPVTELATFVAVVPTYSVAVSASGLRSGVPVTVALGGSTYTELPPFSVSGLTASAYALSVPTVYPNGTTGVRYDPTGVASSLPLSGGVLHVSENGTLALTYAASYALTVTPSVNGTTSPTAGTYWELGGVVTLLTATPSAGHSFSEWAGVGPGSVTSPNASVNVTLTAPITETAYFTTNPYVPPATYALTVTETGLPSGFSWSASIGSEGGSATAASPIVLTGLNGSYVLSVPILPATTGMRYDPSYDANVSLVHANATVAVTFTTQYEVSVVASSGGTASASTTWADAGSTVTLTATANSGETFTGWNGTGTGSYTGPLASTTLTVNAPVTEVATFVPTSSLQPASSSSSGSWLLPIALLVVLLVVGLVVGLLLGRSRPPSGGPAAPPPEADTGEVPVWTETAETTETPPPTSGDDETVYGGGSA